MAEFNTIARPYAQGAFEYARDNNQLDHWSQMLAALSQVVTQPQVKKVLENPSYSHEILADVVMDVAKDNIDEAGRNFVKLIASNNRLAIIPAAANLFQGLKAKSEQTIDVQVTSTSDLDQAQCDRLTQSLHKRFNKNIKLSCQTDSSLLGGLYICAGDIVIDGTIKGQLQRMKESLVGDLATG